MSQKIVYQKSEQFDQIGFLIFLFIQMWNIALVNIWSNRSFIYRCLSKILEIVNLKRKRQKIHKL